MSHLRSLYTIISLDRNYKWVLLKDYLQLLIISWVRSKFVFKPKHEISFLNHSIHFPQLSSVIFLIQEIFIYECYKNPEKETEEIIDIGSHIGLSVLFFHLNNPRIPIKAFELNPSTFYFLKKNIKTNNLKNITIYNKGISNVTGTQFIQLHSSDLNSSISYNTTSNKNDVLDISSIINKNNTYLKLDAEGHEDIIIDRICEFKELQRLNELVIETDKKNTSIQNKLVKIGFTKKKSKNTFYKNLPEEIQVYRKY